MDKRYKHFCSEERGVILAEHRRGSSLREIGLVLGGAASTIRRELARLGDSPYDPRVARSVQDARRLLCWPRTKPVQGSLLHDWVRGKLVHQRWPPEQVAARLRVLYPGDPTRPRQP